MQKRSLRKTSPSFFLFLFSGVITSLTWTSSSAAATSAFDKAFGAPTKNEIVVTTQKAPVTNDHADEYARDAENTAADVCRAMVHRSENCKRILKRVDQEDRHTALRDQITEIIERVPASKPNCAK
jgi:hypothetical protein